MRTPKRQARDGAQTRSVQELATAPQERRTLGSAGRAAGPR